MPSPTLLLDPDTPWILSPDEPEPVRRALEDVRNDWYDVMGHLPLLLDSPPESVSGPVIYLGSHHSRLKELVPESFAAPECFLLRTQKDADGRDAVVATGSGIRGAIYAIYCFSEKILGVDPWHYWVDKRPVFSGRAEVPAGLDLSFGPPTFKWRGWFLNDEDLLNGFAPDPLRENVFSLDLYDKIYETLLRLRGNMVVPATFPFPDERCQELASRRGLALHMHHVLGLGLNTYRWPEDIPYSHSKHPDILEAHWKTCVDAFRDKEVIWTIGYRGRHDQPFWVHDDDASQATDKQRGEVISRAMARQVEMVQAVQPGAPMVANLFMEGNQLYRDGHLHLPEGVTPVWADFGNGMICDGGKVRPGEGVYYHTAMMNNRSNQLTEMVSPERIFKELGRFVRAGATEYLLLNVSDIRPVPLSSDCVMTFAWNAAPWLDKSPADTADDFFLDWSGRMYGDGIADKVRTVCRQYFLAPFMRDEERTLGEHYLCSWILHFHARQFEPALGEKDDLFGKMDRLADAVIEYFHPDGLPSFPEFLGGTLSEGLAVARGNIAHFEPLAREVETLLPEIPASRREFYRTHIGLQVHLHLHLSYVLQAYILAVTALMEKRTAEATGQIRIALTHMDKVFALLRAGETGRWRGWYRGDQFVGVEAVREFLRQVEAMLAGRIIPMQRQKTRYEKTCQIVGGKRRDASFSEKMRYQRICEYQTPFADHFPLLYSKE
ncbi:hypothetical protein OPIT5_30390 [Opitutaceae bacterium TAV5]|nr:hypothetical protein OPIT5_30390 [Opitutaceae bacterium TAV5]